MIQQEHPFLSIIIPTYNMYDTLSNCLQSIDKQNIDNYEVIIVDDHSTDETSRLLADYCFKNKKLKAIIPQRGKGLSNARNIGLSAAKGDYIHFVDADDCIADKTYIKCLEKIIQNQPDILAANYFFKSNSTEREVVFSGATGLSFHLCNNNVAVWNRIFKRTWLLNNHLYFNTSLNTAEDADYVFRSLRRKPVLDISDEIIYIYYFNEKDKKRHVERDLSLLSLKNSLFVLHNTFINMDDISESEIDIWINAFFNYLSFTYNNIWRKMVNTKEKKEGLHYIKETLRLIQKNTVLDLSKRKNADHFNHIFNLDYNSFIQCDYEKWISLIANTQ